MKLYYIQIGTMNGQNNYTIKTNGGAKRAKELALKRHKELGRRTEGVNIYVAYSREV